MFVKKYRVQELDKIIGLPENVKKLVNKDLPHIMLYGKQGTGKSLFSETVCKVLGWDVLHLNGSDTRGIDTIRETVKNFMMSRSADGNPKIIRFEEADQLTNASQSMLRELLETYATNCRVIFTLNYPNKIIDPLKSRCVCVNMSDKNEDEVFNHLKNICGLESIEFEEDALRMIVKKFLPDIRACINKLEEVSRTGKVTKDKIVIDEEKIKELFNLLRHKKFTEARLWCLNSNRESSDLLNQLFKVTLKSDLDSAKKLKIIEAIAETDFRMGLSTDKEVQLSAGLVRIIRGTV